MISFHQITKGTITKYKFHETSFTHRQFYNDATFIVTWSKT